jgi:hypothetical protein
LVGRVLKIRKIRRVRRARRARRARAKVVRNSGFYFIWVSLR